MSKQRKRKPYKAAKEVKRRARILQGQAPSSRPYADRRKKPDKHRQEITEDHQE